MSTTNAQQTHVPPPGSSEREAIMSVARASAAQDLGKQVDLQVKSIHVASGWAFVYAQMTGDYGRAISYADTPFAETASQGGMSDVFVVLLRQLDGGSWQVREHSTGPTDAVWLGWTTQGAPAQIYQVPD